VYEAARGSDGEEVTRGRYPVIDVAEAWELRSMPGVLAPGTEHRYQEEGERRTAWMMHPDGSCARASSAPGDETPTLHQSGPRRLQDLLDDIRRTWLRNGSLHVYGATATISSDGAIHPRRGRWQATITS